MLELSGVTIEKDGIAVLKDVSLSVEPGKVTALLGANGAGKSELVLGIAGLLPVTGGEIRADGKPITGQAPNLIRAAGVAAVPEGHQVLSKLSVDDNLRAAASLLSLSETKEALDRIYALFPELAERKRQIAGTMSGGQQQMLAIGHALMARPRYVLIDEMSLGLAPLIVKRLVGVVSELAASGVGVLLVEQFVEVALQLASDIVVLRKGQVRLASTAEAIAENRELITDAYF
ncbi:ABC transporter ATP-binding protein [Celeribacter neptunius]|uniref:Branched-chain amino acid transport system ATP-binding protein n=1 Tax=Celeribacter neptunius TaxID=588602 RepID=A0A1I3UCP1_9RHOB|nr:ABC transporter ATP-binding protein [Celeribacter neptunius]SFJ79636.1 branched-chain amino acid transport system ATP-binding protein [Celeribacter neptunius]